VVLEALASGVPVITTRYNGAGGIISDGKEGFVLDDPRNVEVLAEKILSLSIPHVLKKTSRAARQLGQRFPCEHSYQEILQVMKRIMN
jgi:UDP-glucose:(heptosyl)LPS alpha-1,3-glucosyltransferase